MKLKFLGAASTVTGSSYLLSSNSGEQILIDLGLFQGPSEVDALNYRPFEANARQLSGIILTHAHLDHCGRLPIVENQGFRDDIYMTAATADLTELSLLDSAKISLEDRPEKALYDKTAVSKLVKRFRTVDYGEPIMIGSFRIKLRDAGHIIGSASVEIMVDEKTIVFSGDLGNTPEDLTNPTEMFSAADIVIMESTYGDRAHPPGEPNDILKSEIESVTKSGGTLLIPAFSLERSQELLHILSHMKPQIPVYIDSPMANRATAIYRKYKSMMNPEIAQDFKKGDPFSFMNLHVVQEHKESEGLHELPGAKVIIAGSGMMTGGRIVNHAKKMLPIATTRLLIVGYQGEGTLGRKLLEGEKKVRIDGQDVQVAAQITNTQTMSSHADQPRLMNWLKNIKGVKTVFLTHGEDGPRKVLKEKIGAELGISDVQMPTLNQEIVL